VTFLKFEKTLHLITDKIIISKHEGKTVRQDLLLRIRLKRPLGYRVPVGPEFLMEKFEVFLLITEEENFFVHGAKLPFGTRPATRFDEVKRKTAPG
jgi:hypothetical protein